MSASQQSIAQSRRRADFETPVNEVSQVQATDASAVTRDGVPTDDSTNQLRSSRANFSLNSDGTMHRSQSESADTTFAFSGNPFPHDDAAHDDDDAGDDDDNDDDNDDDGDDDDRRLWL